MSSYSLWPSVPGSLTSNKRSGFPVLCSVCPTLLWPRAIPLYGQTTSVYQRLLACFRFGAVMTNGTKNVRVQVSARMCVFSPLGLYPGVESMHL